METPKTLAEARDLISKLQAENEDLKKQLAGAAKPEDVTSLQEQLKKQEGIAENLKQVTAERDKLQADLSESDKKLTAVTAERDQLQADAKTVEEEAASIAAQSGLEAPVAGAPGAHTNDAGGSGDLMEQYQALKTPQERSAFRRKHKEALGKVIKK